MENLWLRNSSPLTIGTPKNALVSRQTHPKVDIVAVTGTMTPTAMLSSLHARGLAAESQLSALLAKWSRDLNRRVTESAIARRMALQRQFPQLEASFFVLGGADQITVLISTTATLSNALSATQLDPIPYDGTLVFYGASTAADSTLSFKVADSLSTDARVLPQVSTTGVPRMSDDVGISQEVQNGQRLALVLTIVTAGTIFGHVSLLPS